MSEKTEDVKKKEPLGAKIAYGLHRNKVLVISLLAVVLICAIVVIVLSFVRDADRGSNNVTMENDVLESYSTWSIQNSEYESSADLANVTLTSELKAKKDANDQKYIDFFKKSSTDNAGNIAGMKALQCLANIYISRADYQNALEAYKSAASQYKGSSFGITASFMVASCQEELKKYDDAIATYQSYIDTYKVTQSDNEIWAVSAPNLPMALFRIGIIKEQRNDLEGALIALNSMVSKYPQSALANDAYNHIISIEAQLGK